MRHNFPFKIALMSVLPYPSNEVCKYEHLFVEHGLGFIGLGYVTLE